MRGRRASSATMQAYAFALVALAAPLARANFEIDPNLPDYTRVAGVSGSIKSVGSDTMNNLMTLWAESFRKIYPGARIEIEGKGSSSAPPALIAGTATFGPMSREMKEKESDAFEKKFGYKPTVLAVGIDMLAIYVHRDNPIAGLTLPEVDAIFSKFRRGAFPHAVRRWGDVGMTGTWADRSISVYGRNAASGTYGYLKDLALLGGDFRDSVQEQPGSSAVIQGVANDRYGIGYSGIGYKTADVRAVPLASTPGKGFVPAEPRFALTGEYPLARSLWLAVNHQSSKPLDPLRREFIRFILSRQGQIEVIKDGYLPITASMARAMLKAVDLATEP